MIGVLLLCFFQFFQEELYIVRQIWPLGLQGTAYEENGIGAVDPVHFLEQLPLHAARGDGEYGPEVRHFFVGSFADFLAGVLGERESAAKAGENDRIRTGQAGKLAIIAEGGNAGFLGQYLGAREAGVEENGQPEFRISGQVPDEGEARNGRGPP